MNPEIKKRLRISEKLGNPETKKRIRMFEKTGNPGVREKDSKTRKNWKIVGFKDRNENSKKLENPGSQEKYP